MTITIHAIHADEVLSDRADAAIMAGAEGSGFLTLKGVDEALGLGPVRDTMLDIFAAGAAPKAAMLRHKYDPARPNVYRGYFPAEPEKNAMLEGFDLGSDFADPSVAGDGRDPLTEPTPRPGLPEWEAAVATYHGTMSRLGVALTKALMRGIGREEELVDRLFARSISTLRLLHYPEIDPAFMDPDRRLEAGGETRYLMTKAHTDSGFVTLLWQDGTGGLQAESAGGWVDVPPAPGGLVVNFGQMLGDWTGGRIRATRHRVIGGLAERFSVPFFLEPAVDAVIEPLFPEEGGTPFVYGDFLWERMVSFPNFHGVTRRPASAAQ